MRNTFFGSLKRRGNEELHADVEAEAGTGIPMWGEGNEGAQDPLVALLRKADRDRIDRALARLPLEFREVVILRELEDLSYNQIAEVVAVPVGTVMSRLSRGRKLLARFIIAEGA